MTPEERLFKIIQNQENSHDESGDSSPASDSGTTAALSEPFIAKKSTDTSDEKPSKRKTASAKSFSGAGSGTTFFSRMPSFFSLATLNRGLGFLTAGCFIFFVSDAFFLQSDPVKLFLKKTDSVVTTSAPAMEVPTSAGINLDPSVIAERNVFRPWTPPVRSEVKVSTAPGYSTKVLTDIKLAGIYMDDTPEALLEAVDEKRTYVVQSGSSMKGMTVKEVKATGVVLTNGNEDFFLQ